jgi:hypothetical protein
MANTSAKEELRIINNTFSTRALVPEPLDWDAVEYAEENL